MKLRWKGAQNLGIGKNIKQNMLCYYRSQNSISNAQYCLYMLRVFFPQRFREFSKVNEVSEAVNYLSKSLETIYSK